MKICKHLVMKNQSMPQLGRADVVVEVYECGLKLKSDKKMNEVYQKLFEIGYEGSLVTHKCPFVLYEHLKGKSDFEKCPYFEGGGENGKKRKEGKF